METGAQHAVLTALGADRPGLVDEVTRFIAEHDGNLEDGRMVNLRGQFVMMLLVAAPPAAMQRLRADLPALAAESRVHADLTPAADARPTTGAAIPYRLSAWSLDHPGLVQSIAHVLRERDVNIESVETTLQSAPITGAPLFAMEFVISVPAKASLPELRLALGAVCDSLNIDWKLEAP
jgi:glycine cleavage system transcriptional repressor